MPVSLFFPPHVHALLFLDCHRSFSCCFRLLDGLQSLEASGRRHRQPKTVENAAEAFGDCGRLACLFFKNSRSFEAKITLHGLEISSPYTMSKVVAVFYHSSMVELKRLIEVCIKEKPYISFEEAVLGSCKALDNDGLTCPFKFRVRIGSGGKYLVGPLVSNVSLALRMRKECLASRSDKVQKMLHNVW